MSIRYIGIITALTLAAGCAKSSAPANNLAALGTTPSLGADSSGGADLRGPTDGTAWFLDSSKTVHVCYEKSDTFVAPNADLTKVIQKAFSTWKSYAANKLKPIPGTIFPSPDVEPIFPGFAFNTEITSAAPGGCVTKNPDLTFYFGVETDQVKQVEAQHEVPVAFAVRTDYAELDAWGKGFIWLNAMWPGYLFPDEDAVFGIVLHELGHVYGCEHVSGTIMDADIAKSLSLDGSTNVDTPANRKFKLTHIDQSRELVVGDMYDESFPGFMFGENSKGYFDSLQPLFKTLMGRDMQGALKVRLRQDFSQSDFKPVLTLGDDKGTQDFFLNALDGSVNLPKSYPVDTQAFSAVMAKKGSDSSTSFFPYYFNAGQVIMLRGEIGTTGYRIEVTWNSSYGALPEINDTLNILPVRMDVTPPSGAPSSTLSLFAQPTDWY